jgi:AcrR family transcriptional regulator
MVTDMKSTRTYTMTARARATAETRRRILQAFVDEHLQRLVGDIALSDVANRAGVSVQTVLRHFGTRAALVDQAIAFAQQAVVERRRTPVGDVPGAVRTIVEHYEQDGDHVLLMLAQEATEPLMSRITTQGKQLHRDWVAEVFAPYLSAADAQRNEVVDLLVVATDVYTWKLMRRDRGLDRTSTEERMTSLVRAVLDRYPTGQQRPTKENPA